MTVMIDSFFGIHPYVIRNGLWGKMKPGEKDLYVYLMEESERRCTRELTITDTEVREIVKTASRTLCNARKKLQEHGLIRYKAGIGKKYQYTICDPRSGLPYPGHPREPIIVPKRSRSKPKGSEISMATAYVASPSAPTGRPEHVALDSYGVPGIFS